MRLCLSLRACALCLLLAGCASSRATAPPFETQPRPALPPALCAQPAAAPIRPAAAGLVRPATELERSATQSLLTWIAALLDHDAMLARRARLLSASPACSP